jgi:hypothetical protein
MLQLRSAPQLGAVWQLLSVPKLEAVSLRSVPQLEAVWQLQLVPQLQAV